MGDENLTVTHRRGVTSRDRFGRVLITTLESCKSTFLSTTRSDYFIKNVHHGPSLFSSQRPEISFKNQFQRSKCKSNHRNSVGMTQQRERNSF